MDGRLGSALRSELARLRVEHSLLLDRVCNSPRTRKVVDHCIDRIIVDGDGGEKGMDTTVAPGVEFLTVDAETSGFVEWEREGAKRGIAEWALPKGWEHGPHAKDRLLFFHGGGYFWYKPQDDFYRALASNLAATTGMPVLSIDYRLGDPNGSDKHHFPACLIDALQAVDFIDKNGPNGPGRADHIFVTGDSAGGGLTLSTLLALHKASSPSMGSNIPVLEQAKGVRIPDAVGAFSPYTDLSASLETYKTRIYDPATKTGDFVFTSGGEDHEKMRADTRAYNKRFVGPEYALTHPLVSPVFAEWDAAALADTDMPPIWLTVGDAEIMLAETTEFADKMCEKGAEVHCSIYPRMWHVFVGYTEGYGVGKLLPAVHALDSFASFIRSKATLGKRPQ